MGSPSYSRVLYYKILPYLFFGGGRADINCGMTLFYLFTLIFSLYLLNLCVYIHGSDF